MKKTIYILGCRGIPAAHGGFETFAEYLAQHLQSKGWEVFVYCQHKGKGSIFKTIWKGIHLVHIPVQQSGALATILFDFKSIIDAGKEARLALTLGYNTSFFNLWFKIKGINNLINMDGIEWKRDKWSFCEQVWLFINEKIGSWTACHLFADHPEIKKHLRRFVAEKKITTIPYGADTVKDADEKLLKPFDLTPYNYCLIVSRLEPENSILEIIKAFCQKKQLIKLVVLGNFDQTKNNYHKKIFASSSNEVIFPGAIYNKPVVSALRYYCKLYIHGHKVGGTNPSLVESMGAGSPVLAHNNPFNKWVAGDAAHYFNNQKECSSKLDRLLCDKKELDKMKIYSINRHKNNFTWKKALERYEETLALFI